MTGRTDVYPAAHRLADKAHGVPAPAVGSHRTVALFGPALPHHPRPQEST